MLKINPLSTLYVGIDVSSKSNYVCALDFYKLSIVFFRFGVFGAVPARTVARKYSKYKAFLYVGL